MVAFVNNREDMADVRCIHCGMIYRIIYNREDMTKWLNGSLPIQDALPYLTAGERELLLSHTCDTCFTMMFSSLDNEM